MATEVTLPALGESVTEGTVTRWLKNVGDTIAVDEPLLEVSTDKVDTEIPSPVAGTLLEIRAGEDDTVEVGAVLAIVIFYKLAVLRLPPTAVFGETMMLVYYVYAMPLGLKIRRGLYADGIWTDGGYIPYGNIGGLTWREGANPTLVILYRWRSFARKLIVPRTLYGEARKVLRDKIAEHEIHFTGKSLDLGAHDERDDV